MFDFRSSRLDEGVAFWGSSSKREIVPRPSPRTPVKMRASRTLEAHGQPSKSVQLRA